MLLNILLATVAGSLLSLLGGVLLLWREDLVRRFSLTLVSFAIGSLLGAAILELLPEALDAIPYSEAAPWLLAGIFFVFLLEKVLHWYHCHDQQKCDYHSFSSSVLFGDAIHNFIDGVVIALSFSAGPAVGIASAVAVFMHEIPQEIGDFGVLLHAGYSRKKVLVYNALTALTALVGAGLGYVLLPWVENFLGYALAFTSGTFLYIAVSDLLPELKHREGTDLGHLFSMGLGIAIIWVLKIYLPE